MNPALGPFAIAALLLVVGGALKAWHPHDTALAVRRTGLPGSEGAVRCGGVAEAFIGAVALLTASAIAAVIVAVSYAAFCAFVAVALARHLPIASCGCFGKTDAPPSWLHVGVTIGASVAALVVAIDPTISPLEVVTRHFPESTAFVVLVAVGVLATFVILTLLPRTLALVSEGNER